MHAAVTSQTPTKGNCSNLPDCFCSLSRENTMIPPLSTQFYSSLIWTQCFIMFHRHYMLRWKGTEGVNWVLWKAEWRSGRHVVYYHEDCLRRYDATHCGSYVVLTGYHTARCHISLHTKFIITAVRIQNLTHCFIFYMLLWNSCNTIIPKYVFVNLVC
jgi:hypothetical protein